MWLCGSKVHGGVELVRSRHMLVCSGHKPGVEVVGSGGEFWLIKVRVIPANPVSILSADVTGREWVDSACIRFNK